MKIQPKFMDIKRIRQTTGVLWKTAIYLTILYLSLNVVASRVHTHIVVIVALVAANDSNSQRIAYTHIIWSKRIISTFEIYFTYMRRTVEMISITHFDFTFFYDGSSKWSIKFVIQPYVILPIVYARYSIDTNDLHLYTLRYNILRIILY